MYTIKTSGIFCFSHVHYRNVKCFLFFPCPLSKREVFSVFPMYAIETWSNFVFHIHHQNMNYLYFSSCTLRKGEVIFGFIIYTIKTWKRYCFSHIHYRNVKKFFFFHVYDENVKYFCFSNVHYWNMECFCFPHWNLRYFLYFQCTLSKREAVFVFLMYTIETRSIFCFSHICYCRLFSHVDYWNVRYFLFFTCTLSKFEIVFIFLMYTIKMWGIFVSLMYSIETSSAFVFLIETWGIFCISNVHYLNVKQFLFFSCTLSKHEVFFVSPIYAIVTWSFSFFFFIYTIKTWITFFFLQVHYRNVKSFLFL